MPLEIERKRLNREDPYCKGKHSVFWNNSNSKS